MLREIFQDRVLVKGDELFPTNTEKINLFVKFYLRFSPTDLFIVSTLQA